MIIGPGYRTDSIFDLAKMQPYNLRDILLPFQKFTSSVALYLPRTSDLRQLIQAQEAERKLPVVHYCMEGASKVREISRCARELLNTISGPLCILWKL